MFNDFKIRTYSNTPNKLRVLKDIFDRLSLDKLEERLSTLDNNIENVGKLLAQLSTLTKPIVLPPNVIPSLDGLTYVIFHAHNPEDKEIGQFCIPAPNISHQSPDNPILIINAASEIIIPAPQVLEEHESKYLIPSGKFQCSAMFNDIAVDLGKKSFIQGTITTLTVVFQRTDVIFQYNYDNIAHGDYLNNYILLNLNPFDVLVIGLSDFYYYSGGFADAELHLNPQSYEYKITLTLNTASPLGYATADLRGILQAPFNQVINLGTANQIPLSIPISSEFNDWFVQGLQMGRYPSIFLLHTNVLGVKILENRWPDIEQEPKKSFVVVSAKNTYSAITLRNELYATVIPDRGHASISVSTPPIPQIETKIITGSLLGGLKMSSIPYDLEGNAF